MDVFEAIENRHSVRGYTGRPIPREDLDMLFRAARDAPSAKNLQPWRFIAVTDRRMLKELVPVCHNQGFVEDAGALVVGITEDEKWSVVDLAIALDHLSLAATALGLGTCWIGAFHPDEMGEKLGVPDHYAVTMCMTVGYPSTKGKSPTKKSVSELVCMERYKER